MAYVCEDTVAGIVMKMHQADWHKHCCGNVCVIYKSRQKAERFTLWRATRMHIADTLMLVHI